MRWWRCAACSAATANWSTRFATTAQASTPSARRALFQPFHRLHEDHEFQGTGIGLTIVQRIIQRHGGAIRAIGDVGQGACFEFSLGPRDAANSTIAGTLPDVSQPQPLDSTVAPSREIAA